LSFSILIEAVKISGAEHYRQRSEQETRNGAARSRRDHAQNLAAVFATREMRATRERRIT